MEGVADRIAQEHLENVRVKADFIAASCPVHEDRNPSFWINRFTGEWGCFSCHARGSDLKELLKVLGVRNRSVEALVDQAKQEAKKYAKIDKAKRQKKARQKLTGQYTLPDNVLGVWDYCPVMLLDAGFEEEILDEHEIGFDKVRDRVTFPIRDIEGSLIGVSGRTVTGQYPKYKVYQGWHDGPDGEKRPGELGDWYPGYSSTDIRNHLWRGDKVYRRLFDDEENTLIVVEGYKAALWLVQHGWENTVALMGSRMSQGQARIIKRMGADTWILLDNNQPGLDGAEDMGQRLGNCSFPVYRCWYPQGHDENAQPDDLTADEIKEVLYSATRVAGRVKKRHGYHRR